MRACAVCGSEDGVVACAGCGRAYCAPHKPREAHACPTLDGYTKADHRVAIGFTPAEMAENPSDSGPLRDLDEASSDSARAAGGETQGEPAGDVGNRFEEPSQSPARSATVSPPTGGDWLWTIAGKVAVVVLIVALLVAAAVAFGSFSVVRATGMASLEPVDRNLEAAGEHIRAALPVLDGPVEVSSVVLGAQDTDGDRLPDDREGEGVYRAADPGHKDLYVRIVVGAAAEPVPAYLRRDIVQAFAEMPVGNPDGTRGIEVHIVAVDRVADPITIPHNPDNIEAIVEQIPPAKTELPCETLHTVVVADFDRPFAGRGTAPGTFSYVDRSQADGYRGDTAFIGTVVHELLHNIVGQRLPETESTGPAHSTEGWLRSRHDGAGSGHYLSTATQQVLNDGFARIDRAGWTCAIQ